MAKLIDLVRAECGATAIEYGLILALLALAMLAALDSLGFTLAGVFEAVSAAMRG
jgi:pilus assembly protein Flp/PilA